MKKKLFWGLLGVFLGISLLAAVAGNLNLAYIAGTYNLYVLDLNNFKFIARLPLSSPAKDIAILPEGTFAYLAHPDTGSVSRINTSKLRVSKKIKVGVTCANLAMNTRGSRLLVSDTNGKNKVVAIDTLTDKVVGTAMVGITPNDVIVSLDDKFAFVANSGSRTISRIRLSDYKVLDDLPIGQNPQYLAVNPDNSYLVCPCYSSDDAYIIKTKDFALQKVLNKLEGPSDAAFDPWGKYLFITSYWGYKLKVFTADNLKLYREISLKGKPSRVLVNPNRKHIYVILDDHRLQVINLQNFALERQISFPENIYALVIRK